MKLIISVILIFVLIAVIFTPHIYAELQAGRLSPVASFWGPEEHWRLGYFLSQAGDVNGDGYDDFMIGAYHDCTYDFNTGAVYLFLGRSTINWGEDCPVKSADHIFYGRQEYDLLGFNFAGGGDINGDGYSDILIGAPGNWEGRSYAGETFILLGRPDPVWEKKNIPYHITDASFVGEDPYEQLGYCVAFAGDVNSDGYDEVLFGVPYKNCSGEKWNGKAWLIAGRADGWDIRHAAIADGAAASFVYSGNEALTGFSVAGVGDINADGFQDFAISAPGAQFIFLLFGKSELDWGFNFDLQNADLKFLAEMENDDAGNRVVPAGDVNGDGIDDFLIASTKFKFHGGGYEGGKTYLIFGRRSWSQTDIPLSEAEASYLAEGRFQHAGFGLSPLGDIDADRYSDFMIGARWYSGTLWHCGKAYLIGGKESGWQRNSALKDCRLFFRGERAQSCVGWSVSTAGDVNGDGLPDYIISAPFDREAGVCTGQVYLFQGKADHSNCNINGIVSFWKDDMPLENVEMRLIGEDHESVMTGQSGEYGFLVPISRDYVVTPNFSVNGQPAITAYDAWITARCAVNLDTPSKFQAISADINRDNRLTVYDASLILQYSVGKVLPPKYNIGRWIFSPDSSTYSPAIYETELQNYTGILMGDVDGSWSSKDSSGSQDNVALIFPVSKKKQHIVSYPITLKSRDKIYAFQAAIEFDPSKLRFTGFDQSNIADDLVFDYHLQSDNRLKISGYSLHGLNEPACGIIPQFELTDDSLTTIKLLNPVVNTTKLEYTPISATVKNDSEQPAQFSLHQNYPNPFNPATTIPYSLQEESRVVIKIWNIRGRLVRIFDAGIQSAGSYRLEWDGRDQSGKIVPGGIYLYSIQADRRSIVKKMVKLQ